MAKTREEVEALKKNWLEDPCYDLVNVEGFEEYHYELFEFVRVEEQKNYDAYHRIIVARENETGLKKELLLTDAVMSFSEIQKNIPHSGDFCVTDAIALAQVNATLLLAAQVQRVADLLSTFPNRS